MNLNVIERIFNFVASAITILAALASIYKWIRTLNIDLPRLDRRKSDIPLPRFSSSPVQKQPKLTSYAETDDNFWYVLRFACLIANIIFVLFSVLDFSGVKMQGESSGTLIIILIAVYFGTPITIIRDVLKRNRLPHLFRGFTTSWFLIIEFILSMLCLALLIIRDR